jgi:dihydrofolate reductase
MGIVLASHSMSLDGFIARPDGQPGPLHDWAFAGEHASRHAESARMSEASRDVFDRLMDSVGATVVGRRTYDDSGGWGGQLPFDWPFFVVTHERPENAANVPFEFVTEGVERAVELARAAAGDKDVSVGAGDVVRQCLAAGLLDRIDLNVVPVLLGDGVRMFQDSGAAVVELEPAGVVDAPGVTHVSFRVARWS